MRITDSMSLSEFSIFMVQRSIASESKYSMFIMYLAIINLSTLIESKKYFNYARNN